MTNDGEKSITKVVHELLSRKGGIYGRDYVEMIGAFGEHDLTVFRNKFSPYYLKSLNLKAKTIIDVGVNYGTPDLYNAFPDCEFVLVEPIAELLDECLLRYPWLKNRCFACACGAQDDELEFNLMPISGHNSFLERPNSHSKKRPIPVRRLDGLIQADNVQLPLGLKIDTEGYELEVLKGASNLLPDIEFIIAEISVKNIFQGGYRFSQAIEAFASKGFQLFDVLNMQGFSPNALDCLFLRQDDERFL